MAELPQKVYYRTPEGGIALNLFTNSKKAFDVKGQTVTILQETAYPNDGDVKLTFSTEPKAGGVRVSVPHAALVRENHAARERRSPGDD